MVPIGCQTDLGSIDDEIETLARERAGEMGVSRQIEGRRSLSTAGREAAWAKEKPPTINPRPEELRYSTADEARDVAARLNTYTSRQLSGAGNDGISADLAGVMSLSQRSGREFLSAEEDYLLAAIRLLVERHQWSPRFFNDTSLTMAGGGVEGRFDHALLMINTLRATQRLPYGGEVEAKWLVNATDQLRSQVTGRYVQASSLGLSGTMPLLRGAGEVAREPLVDAERELVYQARSFERFRREYLVSIASDYYALIQSRSQIDNQERQLASLKEFENAQRERVSAGRIREFERAIAENEVLRATADLAGQREFYVLQLDRFKIRLGLPPDQALEIKPLELELRDPEEDPVHASQLALDLRLDLQTSRDRVDDAKRAVANARNALLPDLNITGGVNVPTPGNTGVGGLGLSPDDLDYSLGLTLSLPLDRKSETLALRTSLIGLERSKRDFERSRDNVVVEVRAALRNVELSRFQLRLAEKAVEINIRRLEEQQLRIDTVDPQRIVDSNNEKLRAENARDRAKTDLRIAILRYLLATDQLRVAPDGTFQELPGMHDAPAK